MDGERGNGSIPCLDNAVLPLSFQVLVENQSPSVREMSGISPVHRQGGLPMPT